MFTVDSDGSVLDLLTRKFFLLQPTVSPASSADMAPISSGSSTWTSSGIPFSFVSMATGIGPSSSGSQATVASVLTSTLLAGLGFSGGVISSFPSSVWPSRAPTQNPTATRHAEPATGPASPGTGKALGEDVKSCTREGEDEEKEEQEEEGEDDGDERKRRKRTKQSESADGRRQEDSSSVRNEAAGKTRNTSRKAEDPSKPEAEHRERGRGKSWCSSTPSGEHHDQIWNPHGFIQHLSREPKMNCLIACSCGSPHVWSGSLSEAVLGSHIFVYLLGGTSLFTLTNQ